MTQCVKIIIGAQISPQNAISSEDLPEKILLSAPHRRGMLHAESVAAMKTALDRALELYAYGLAPIPIIPGTKRPAVRIKPFFEQGPSPRVPHLVLRAGRGRGAVRSALRPPRHPRLRQHAVCPTHAVTFGRSRDLARADGARLALQGVNLDEIASKLGTSGMGVRQRAEHVRQRENHRVRLRRSMRRRLPFEKPRP